MNQIIDIATRLDTLKQKAREKYVLHRLSGEQGGREGDYVLSPDDLDALLTSSYQAGVEARDVQYKGIFDWLHGLSGDFPDLSQKPHYCFRTELRERLQALSKPADV